MKKIYLSTLLLTVSFSVFGTTYNLSATIDQAQEVPATGSPATGSMSGTYDDVTNQLSYNITYTGLTGSLSAGHFHGNAPAGVSAGVKVGFTTGASPMIGTVTVAEGDESQFLAGNWYINLHTSTFGGGEIRGQVMSAILPVELSAFKISQEQHIPELSWKTQSERNVQMFEIQKSIDAVKFETVGTVQASGNSTTPQYYAFKDAAHNAVATYYRLKMVDKDGSFAFSWVIALNAVAPKNKFNVYPNPTKDGSLNLKLTGICSNLVITNQYGQVMKTSQHVCSENMDITDLPDGLYFFSVDTPTGKQVQQVVKMK